MKKIKFCNNCSIYTLKDKCPKCSKDTVQNVPPKFSPEDKHAKYRRIIKEKMLKEKRLI